MLNIVEICKNETLHFSNCIRNSIPEYGNGVDLSTKKTLAQREEFILKSKNNELEELDELKLKHINVIFRLFHSKNMEYFKIIKKFDDFFKELNLKKKLENSEMVTIFYENYEKTLNLNIINNIDQYQSFCKFANSEFNIDQNHPTLAKIYQLLIQIQNLENKLLKTPIIVNNIDIAEYEISDKNQPNYIDPVENIINHNTKELDNPYLKSIKEEYEKSPIDLIKKKFIIQKKQKADTGISVHLVEDVKNYIMEFFKLYKDVITEGREFWSLMMFEILRELSSEKSDYQIKFFLESTLNHEEAAEYLLTYRKDIVKYLKMVRFFDPIEEDVLKRKMEEKKKIDKEMQKPMNFVVRKGNNTNIDINEGDLEGNLDNHKILKLVGISGEEINKESKLGLKKRKVQVTHNEEGIQIESDAFSEHDFVKMDQKSLVSFYPFSERKDEKEYIHFIWKPMPKIDIKDGELVQIDALPKWAQEAFHGVSHLNTIQSEIYENAFNDESNLLVCAPTGAGKTNVALLAILQVISRFLDKETGKINKALGDFKIVYICPMKALAGEIVDKFSARLSYLGAQVKELTGDMQLTRAEIAFTHVIVTTPEKWDVITRKSDGLSSSLKLLIIDEIHLLNDERGPVLECLVSRTLRAIERLQSTIRLVGLSATLPNYLDVAIFLGVPKHNVFFFDSRYRPVPLLQNFIGVKEPFQIQTGPRPLRRNKRDIYNDICYNLVRTYAAQHKQVMIFVHSRKETLTTAEMIIEKMQEKSDDAIFKPPEKLDKYLEKVRSKALRGILPYGAGIHNAGLLRRDRNLVEQLFLAGKIRFLVTTATLAWGVNLPAYAVIIKGTDVYDPQKGTTDISILDIQQIFGRAGRPQFDSYGEATLITDFGKVNQYIGQLTNSSYIESRLLNNLKENLNAEISLKNISNIFDALDWLKRTFLGVRIARNPIAYGLRINNTNINAYIQEKVTEALEALDRERLIRYDKIIYSVSSTELGRIASHFYVKTESMSEICKEIDRFESAKDRYWSDLALMKMISKAKEFESLRVREDEVEELKKLLKKDWIFEENLEKPMKRGPGDKNIDVGITMDLPEKIIAIINGYLNKVEFETFSLVIDGNYIAQNAVRLLRCVLEIALKKNMAALAELTLKWCRYMEHRISPNELPLRHFTRESYTNSINAMRLKKQSREGFLDSLLAYRLEESGNLDLYELIRMNGHDIGQQIGASAKIGGLIKSYVNCIPQIEVEHTVKPIAQTILKVQLFIKGKFDWKSRWHGGSQLFLIIVDDEKEILHSENISLTSRNMEAETSFYVPYKDTSNKMYRLKVCAEDWCDCDFFDQINLEDLSIFSEKMEYTPMLTLQPLPTNALNNVNFENIYTFNFFNPIQTQLFHSLYHTDNNTLIGAPTGSGKTILAEIAILRVFSKQPDNKVIYIAPLKAIAKERLKDWKKRFEQKLNKNVVELTGDYTPDLEALMKADILITTPEKWDGISRNWQQRAYAQKVSLLVIDELHLLGQDRGPVLEVIVSRMNYMASKLKTNVRMIGLSTAMANGPDVANWFGVSRYNFFNFKSNIRPVPIKIYFDGFSEKHYCPRMATMNKPAFDAIKKFSEGKPVLIFVSSRRQTRLTALDLIALISTENIEKLEPYLNSVKDSNLKQTLNFGIGMHHAGLTTDDRKVVEDLFVSNKIQVLIATSTLAWGVNFPARLVIIKGTEFFDPKKKGYVDFPVTDLLQMIGRAGRPQFDNLGIACVFVEESKKNFYKKYLNDPFPIESSLLQQLSDHINAETAAGTLSNKQNCIDYLSWTYLFRRLLKNPLYYGLKNSEPKEINQFLAKIVESSLSKLNEYGCIKLLDDYNFEPTFLGHLASYYYVKPETINIYNKQLVSGLSIYKLSEILSNSMEFDEVPVRHNEDNLNEGLAKICPFKVNMNTLDSPHTKTLLLFQAHFGRLPLPIRDYITDTKLILDGAVRMIHCMIDLTAEKGYLDSVLNLTNLMQMVTQGVWANESGLKNLPNITNEILKELNEKHSIKYLCQLIDFYENGKLFRFLQEKKLEKEEINEILEELDYIPKINFKADIDHFDSEKFEKVADKNGLIEEGEAMVTVNLKRINSKYPLRVKMLKTLKIKDASWWIAIGCETTNEIYSLKKIYFKTTLKKQIQINLPENFKNNPNVSVFLISDSYIGIDQIEKLKLFKRKVK